MKQIYGLLLLIFLIPSIYGQVVPAQPTQTNNCDQNLIMTRVLSEHQTTRKYVNDAIQTKVDFFYTEFNKRLDYMEKTYDKMIMEAVLKLGAMMLGISLFVTSIYAVLLIYFRKRTYTNLKKDILEQMNKDVDIVSKLHTDMPTVTMQQSANQTEINQLKEYINRLQMQTPPPAPPPIDKAEMLRKKMGM